jgi:hypothetical protein
VVASAEQYEVFERMHYVCFHYEFEHQGDPDVECPAGGCPAAGITLPSLLFRTEGLDLAQAGNTVVPAILALEKLGFAVEHHDDGFAATARGSRFVAEDPVALLGLIKLVETRRPWRATDAEIDDALGRYDL